MKSETFDYIVVGAGTACCVPANRLSADPEVRVLRLEVGDIGATIFHPVGACGTGTANDPLTVAPGYTDFLGHALPALDAVETAAIVINAQNGIELGAHDAARAKERPVPHHRRQPGPPPSLGGPGVHVCVKNW